VSFTHPRRTPKEIARYLGERGIFVWHGNYYALPLTEALGVEPNGMVRVGALHYNTPAEIDRLVAALREMKM
jgi:selenocysteine lyase/cysteine desulfurase